MKAPYLIDIPRRAAICANDGSPLLKGKEYFSMLVEGAKEGTLERRDYCYECGMQLLKSKAFENAVSYWKSAIPAKKEPSDLPKEREAQAFLLLKEVLGSKEPTAISQAFVLALYLARRRRLILRQEITLADGQPALVYEATATEEMLCVPKIALSELQVEKVQNELAAKFKK